MPGPTWQSSASGGQLVEPPTSTAESTAGAPTKSNVSASASSVTVLAANTSRKKYCVFNDSSAVLYLDLSGGTASTTSYSVQVQSLGYYESNQPVGTGAITGIWASATGAARVTEWA